MSNEALTAISKADIRPSGRKFVAMALADYADEDWSCFPSVSQLASYTSQGEKTVRDHLDGLERDGILSRERHRREDGTLGRYRFKIHRRNLPVDQRRISPEADFARGEKQPEPAADFATHNPQLEPSLTSPREPTPFDELSKVLDAEHANAVIAHRKGLRSKFTAYAARLLAVKFAKTSDPNAAADVMIANGWQGFEPEWMTSRQQARGSPPSRPQNVSPMTAARNMMRDHHEQNHYDPYAPIDDISGPRHDDPPGSQRGGAVGSGPVLDLVAAVAHRA